MTLLKTSLLLSLLSLHAQAAPACLDRSVVALVESRIALPDELAAAKLDPCDEKSPKYRLLESLQLIKTIKFDTASKPAAPLNADILPTDFWGYFSARANAIVNEPKTNPSCAAGFMAFVYGGLRDGVVHLCPVFYQDSQSVYDRAATMLHEVRHFAGFAHVTCTRGPDKGRGGSCDTSIKLKGSYAVTVESITKMALLAKDLSPAARFMLKTNSLAWSDSSFNELVLPNGFTSVYLTSPDGKGFFFDGKELIDAPFFEKARVVSRQSSLTVFPDDKSDAFTFDYFSKTFDHLAALGSMALGYNKIPQEQRPSFVDVANWGHLSGFVSDDVVQGKLDTASQYTTLKLDSPAKALYVAEELGLPANNSYYVLTEKNQMQQIQFLPNDKYKLSPVANATNGFRALALLNGRRYGVSESGALEVNSDGKWAEVGIAQPFDHMTRPVYWTEYFMPKADPTPSAPR